MRTKAQILIFLVPAAMIASLFATPVEAGGERHHRQVSVHRHHRAHRHDARPRVRVHRSRHHERFRIPERIHGRDARRFRAYYRTSEYYRPHRHRHYVYEFPVWTPRGYVYRPHRYCDGVLFPGGHIEYHGRHVSFGFDF